MVKLSFECLEKMTSSVTVDNNILIRSECHILNQLAEVPPDAKFQVGGIFKSLIADEAAKIANKTLPRVNK